MRFLPLLFFGLIVGLTLSFNYYKLGWIYHLSQIGAPYKIFPWSYPGQVSSSPYWWLMIHPVMGVALQILTVLQMGLSSKSRAKVERSSNFCGLLELLCRIHKILHYLFSGFVLINIWRFGEAPPIVAVLLQGTLLAIMQWRMKGWIYFLALSSAPLLEVGLFVRDRFF